MSPEFWGLKINFMGLGFRLLLFFAFAALPLSVGAQDFIKELITKSPGPLSDHHAEYDNVQGCINCHQKALGGEVANDKCLDCHPKIKVRLEETRGYHRDKPVCENCHAEHKGRDAIIFAPKDWKLGFDHEYDADYALVGKHGEIECYDCHNQKRVHYETGEETDTISYLDAPVECIDCHESEYEHDFTKEKWLECTMCHSSAINEWKELARRMAFDHNETDYKLEGLHKKVECVECHEPNPRTKRVEAFQPIEFSKCTDCHTDPHKGKFGPNCTQCHNVYRDWNDVHTTEVPAKGGGTKQTLKGFDHSTTDFPLVGYHQAVDCESCHFDKDAKFKVAKQNYDQCSDCHGMVHGEQFARQECTDCHREDLKWFESTYTVEDHARSDFPLDGKHQVLDCQKCHFNGQFKNIPHEECSDCHRNVHPERQIDQTCSFCHVTTSFSWIQFDHNKNTDFKLTGQHRDVACLSCHVEQIFKNMPANNANPNCQGCHADPHGKSMDNECANCHRTEGFKLVRNFDHQEQFGYALEGRHSELSCQKCHSNHLLGDYQIPKTGSANRTECANCHYDIHRGQYGQNCESCHNVNSFAVEQGDKIHDLGFFKLEGAHDLMDCNDCHADNTSLAGMGMYCGGCHEKNDIHLGKFGGQCGDCHNQMAWLPTKFKHNTTGFRLTGAHRYVECSSCHVNQVYAGLPNDCYFCHADSFTAFTVDGRANTFHGGGNGVAILDCADCHSTIDWSIQVGPGRFLP